MKKMISFLMFLFIAEAVNAELEQESSEEEYNRIVHQVLEDQGELDEERIESEFKDWLVLLNDEDEDEDEDEDDDDDDETKSFNQREGYCQKCLKNINQNALLNQPRNIRIVAPQIESGYFATTFKILWDAPIINQQQKNIFSHYVVTLQKKGSRVKLYKVAGSILKHSIYFKNKTMGSYKVSVQAVYLVRPKNTRRSTESENTNKAQLIASPFSKILGFVTTKAIKTIKELKGQVRECAITQSNYIPTQLISDITNLNCSYLNLTDVDITTISAFSNLRYLTLYGNSQITDISPLQNLALLRGLYLRDNTLVDLNALSGFSSLVYLNVQSLGLTQVPASINSLNNLQYLWMNNNNISSGFENVPSQLFLLSLTGNNSIQDCSTFSTLQVQYLVIGGSGITSTNSCENLPNLKYFYLTSSQNLNPTQNLDNFTGFCSLTLSNTNIEQIQVSRPIGQLGLYFNNKLKSIDVIKPSLTTATDTYPDLIPRYVNLLYSDNMSCSALYQTKAVYDSLPVTDLSVPVTTTVGGVTKTLQSCGVKGAQKTFYPPKSCVPDLVSSFQANKAPDFDQYQLSWSKQNHDVWGVTFYEIRIDGAEIRQLPYASSLPLSLNLSGNASASFEIRACTQSGTSNIAVANLSCGDWVSTITQTGIGRIQNLNYSWADKQEGTFKLNFNYPSQLLDQDSSTPDYFVVFPSDIQLNSTIIQEIAVVSKNASYRSSIIDMDQYFDYKYFVKACKTTTSGVDVCGHTNAITLDRSRVLELAAPTAITSNNIQTTTGEISFTFEKNLINSLVDIDYFKVKENHPSAIIDGPPINIPPFDPKGVDNFEEYTIDADTNDQATLNLIRHVNGNYTFAITACKTDTKLGDGCSQTPLLLSLLVNRTIKNQADLSHTSNAPIEDLNFQSVYLHKVGCNTDTTDAYYDGNKCTAFDFDYWYVAGGGWRYYPYKAYKGFFHKQALKWKYKNNSTVTTPDYFYLSKINQINAGKNKDLRTYPYSSLSDPLSLNSCVNKLKKLYNIDSTQVQNENFYGKQSIVHRSADLFDKDQWSTTTDCSNGIRVNSDGMWKIQACYDGIGCTNGKTIDMNTPNGYKSVTNNKKEPAEKLSKATTQESIKAAATGPGDLQPGLWWNPYQSGTGWYFYWKNNSPNPNRELNDSYDLLAYWTTYRKVGQIWSPVWMHAKLRVQQKDSTGYQYYTGELNFTQIESNQRKSFVVGTLDVLINKDVVSDQKAKIKLQINQQGLMTYFDDIDRDDKDVPNEYLISGENSSLIIPLEIASIKLVGNDYNVFGSQDDGDHFQGAWEYRTNIHSQDADILIWKIKRLEVMSYFVFDDAGQPLWIQSQSCGNPCNQGVDIPVGYYDGFINESDSFGSTSRNFFTLANAFNPLGYSRSTNVAEDFDFGFVAKGGRNFLATTESYKTAGFWLEVNEDVNSFISIAGYDLTLPENQRTINKSYGSKTALLTMDKVANIHHIGFNIQDIYGSIKYLPNTTNIDTTCDQNEIGPCVISFNWYSDGGYENITPFYKKDGLGEFVGLNTICTSIPTNQYLVSNYKCKISDAGEYEFELRKPAYNSNNPWVTIAESKKLTIIACDTNNGCTKPPTTNIPEVSDSTIDSIASEVSNQSGAGPIPGSGGVSGGSATYNLPLAIPPGRNGMTPSLSVNYSSKGGNGILGVGWSLSVGSSIYRCPQTLAQDGKSLPVTLDNTDRLCLDGQRLMLKNTTNTLPTDAQYWSATAEYRTEQNSFAKVTKTATSYKVQTKSGRINTYSYQGDNNIPVTWSLKKESDTFGNDITYNYNENVTGRGINEILLTTITYSGSNNRRIELQYIDRSDYNISYLAGQETELSKVLSVIRTFYPNTNDQNTSTSTLARTYTFSYLSNNSRATGRTLLDKVTEKVKSISRDLLITTWSQEVDSQWGNHYPKTELKRISLESLDITPPDYQDGWVRDLSIFKNGITRLDQVGDFSGNGIKELLVSARQYDAQNTQYLANSYTVSLDSEENIVEKLSGSLGKYNLYDFDKDGRMDRAFFVFDEVTGTSSLKITKWKLSSTPNSNCVLYFESSTLPGAVNICTKLDVLDIGLTITGHVLNNTFQFYDDDNDGDLDLFVTDVVDYTTVINCQGSTTDFCDSIYKYTNNSSRGDVLDLSTTADEDSYATLERVSYTGFNVVTGSSNTIPLYFQLFKGFKDLNNDGVPEILLESFQTVSTPATSTTYLALNPATGTYKKVIAEELLTAYRYSQWMDINNDGLDDLLVINEDASNNKNWAIKLNTGAAIFDSSGSYNANLFKNINSDNNDPNSSLFLKGFNLTDYGFPSSSGCKNCFPTPYRSYQNRLIDINADGKPELLIPQDLYWNSCRVYLVGTTCSFPLNVCGIAKASDTVETIIPTSFIVAQNTIQNKGSPSTSGAGGEPYLLCSSTTNLIPTDINGVSISVDGSYYTNGNNTVGIPYSGTYDHSIYGFTALEFKLEKGKLVVNNIPTDLIADVNGGKVGDINNDGISDFYSSLGCEWQGCLSSGYAPTGGTNLVDYENNSTYDSNLDVSSVFNNYINDFFTGIDYVSQTLEFKKSIKEKSSIAINKTTAVMPDMLISVTKPYKSSTNSTYVQWQYHPLSASNTATGRTSDYPLYQVKERNCTQAQLDTNDNNCNSYVDEPGVKGDHFYFNSSMYVVSEMRQTNNYGNNSLTEYAYEEAVYNNKGRGFQGFRTIKVRNNPDELSGGINYETISESTFHQVFPLAGKLEKVTVSTGTGVMLSIENYCYQGQIYVDGNNPCITDATSFNTDGAIVYHPLRSKYVKYYELNTSTITSTNQSTFVNDQYGNITSQTSILTSNLTGGKARTETTVTTNNYINDLTYWWLDKLDTTKVTKSVSDTRIGSPTTIQHITQSKFIWKTGVAQRRELDCRYTSLVALPTTCAANITDNNVSRNSFAYDINGNIINVTTTATNYANTKSSRSVATTYTTDGYFLASIKKEGLITSFDNYDNATGQARKITAPDDNYVNRIYDVFGFKTSDTSIFAAGVGSIPVSYRAIANCTNPTTTTDYCYTAQNLVNNLKNTNYQAGTISGAPKLIYYTEQRQDGQPHIITWYDSDNNPVITKTYHSDNITTFNPRTLAIYGTKYNYVINITSPLGVNELSTQPFVNVEEAFPSISMPDIQGRIIIEITKIGDLSNNSSGNCQLQTLYDYFGALTKIIVISSGNCSSTTVDMLSMDRTYDVTGKLLSTTTDSLSMGSTVKYWYDASGNPLILQDASGLSQNRIVTTFDALGRKQKIVDPNMGTKTFAYNGFGEVIEQIDSETNSTYYQYDSLGRITEQYSNVTNALSPIVGKRSYHDVYIYDSKIPGKLSEVTRDSNLENNECGTNCFQEHYRKVLNYDSQKRISDETIHLTNALTIPYYVNNSSVPDITGADNVSYTTRYYYDGYYNRLKQTVYDFRYSIEHQYTKYGVLNQQLDAQSNPLMKVTGWNYRGQETRREFNGYSDIYSTTSYYASTGQVKQIKNATAGDDEVLDYKYDNWGNIIQQDLTRGTSSTANEQFTYDQLHRLTSATVLGSSSVTYTYDKLGNITSKSDFASSYKYGGSNTIQASCGNRTSVPGPNAVYQSKLKLFGYSAAYVNYAYDKRGNRVKDCFNYNTSFENTYTYDYNNLLIESKRIYSNQGYWTKEMVVFNYGPDNLRYRKYQLLNKELTLYGNKDYEQIYKNKLLNQEKFYLTSYLTITRDYTGGTIEKLNFTQKDRLGSTTQILDENGNVLHTKSYDAFGKPRNGDWSDMGGLFDAKLDFADVDASGNVIGTIDISKRGFTDHEHLDEMQLIHMNGRMYDYNNGRFLSVDPFIQAPTSTQSMNPYTYIFNNPLSGVDPTGYVADIQYQVQIESMMEFGGMSQEEAVNSVAESTGKALAAIDTASDFVNPLKGAGKKLIKEGFKGLKKLVVKALKNGKDKVKSTLKKNKNISEIKAQKNLGTKGGDRAGKNFTQKGKKEVIQKNKQKNNGVTKCKDCGVKTVRAKKSQKNVTPPKNETQVDHIQPKSKGGDGSPSNGQVLCRSCNRQKSDKVPKPKEKPKEPIKPRDEKF